MSAAPLEITTEAPATMATTSHPGSTLLQATLAALLTCCALGLRFADVWYGKLVGLSDSDVLHATWLSDTQMDPWLAGVLATGVPVAMMLLGAGYGVAKNRPFPVLLAVVLAAGTSTLMTDTSQFLLAEMTGNVRVGCFDWSSQECRQMLDVPVGNAPSIHIKGATEDDCPRLTPSYEARERQVEAQRQSHVLEYLTHPSRLKVQMDAQRAEVARFRASSGVSH